MRGLGTKNGFLGATLGLASPAPILGARTARFSQQACGSISQTSGAVCSKCAQRSGLGKLVGGIKFPRWRRNTSAADSDGQSAQARRCVSHTVAPGGFVATTIARIQLTAGGALIWQRLRGQHLPPQYRGFQCAMLGPEKAHWTEPTSELGSVLRPICSQ